MTVETTVNTTTHLTNGATTEFPFYFLVFEAAHLEVRLQDLSTSAIVAVPGGSYTISGLGNDEGGKISFPTAPVDNQRLIIQRIVPYKQTLDIVNQGGFFPDTLERQLDEQVMQIQQLVTEVDRSVKTPVGEETFELPVADQRANKYLSFDPNGNVFLSAGTGADAGLRADLAAPTGGELVGFKRSVPFSREQTVSEVLAEQLLTPEVFRQPGDTALLRLQRFFNALGNGVDGRLDADYIVPSMIVVSNKSKFKIHGNGYTIKMADGAATGYGGSVLYLYQCEDFQILDLIGDGNRDNRTPAEDAGHIFVVDKCHRWRMSRVQAINGTCDGFYISAGSHGGGAGGVVTLADCPSHWVMEDCVALNNYRQGCSVVEGMHGHFVRGRYGLTSGLWDVGNGPCAGIDLEPDNQPTWAQNRIQFITFADVLFDQNQGAGLLITNMNGVKNIFVQNCVFDRNKKAAIESFGDSVEIINPLISGWDTADYTDRVGAPAKRGCIDIGVGAGQARITNPTFTNVSNGGVGNANPLIYTHSDAAPGIDISGIKTDGSPSDIIGGNSPKLQVRDGVIDVRNGGDYQPHVTLNGADAVFENNQVIGAYRRALFCGGARPRVYGNNINLRAGLDGTFAVECGNATSPMVEDNKISLDTATNASAIRISDGGVIAGNNLFNFTSAGNAWSYNGGTPTLSRANVIVGFHRLAETPLAT
jgi:hypothetical protein